MSPAAAFRARLVSGVLWIVLGLTVVGLAVREITSRGPNDSQQLELGVGGFCLLIGLLVLAWWKVGRWLAVVAGGLAGLYGVALILLGTEDVGGFAVSLPIGGSLIAFSVWNGLVASLRGSRAE